jgi:hypothetical protein
MDLPSGQRDWPYGRRRLRRGWRWPLPLVACLPSWLANLQMHGWRCGIPSFALLRMGHPILWWRLLRARGHDEVLRGRGAWIADTVEFAGVDEGSGAGANLGGLAGDGDGEGALHHEEELFVHVLMGRVWRAAGGERGFVDLHVIVRMRGAVEDGARSVGAVLMDGQGIEGFRERSECRAGVVCSERSDGENGERKAECAAGGIHGRNVTPDGASA